MTYSLGVDLGTTYTAAAIRHHQAAGHRLEIVDLGTRSAAVPSVVYLRDDGAVLTGEAAVRRGVTDPTRAAREFKRRMGDTTAILLGGVPYSVDALMASMLRSVVAAVTERQGGAPSAIAIAHPANWGRYKLDLLDQAVRRADLDDVELVTEPEAAAVHYATQERLEPGATVAVYDLGGGTFDVAVLRKTETGFDLLGEPEGIERLGGIDVDEAVFRHVAAALHGALDELDPDDPVAQAAVGRLRDDCVTAKEALSSDTEVTVPVFLPTVRTDVRLTRAELEAMIRPALADTLVVLRRTLRSAQVDPGDLSAVLLVGGSSRIPVVAQMVGADLGRPVALDVHPKHSVAMGAALLAAGVVTAPAVPPPLTQPAGEPLATGLVAVGPSGEPIPAASDAAHDPAVPPTPAAEGAATSERRGRRTLPLVASAAAVAALAVTGLVLLRPGGGDAGADDAPAISLPAPVTLRPTGAGAAPGAPTTTPPPSQPATTNATPGTVTAGSLAPPSTTPVDPCADAGDQPCVVVDALRVTDTGAVEVSWSPRNFVPDVESGFHAHLYWNTGSAAQASTDAPDQVPWDAVQATVHTSAEVLVLSNRPPDATGVCATVGEAPSHVAHDPTRFHCLPLPDGSF